MEDILALLALSKLVEWGNTCPALRICATDNPGSRIVGVETVEVPDNLCIASISKLNSIL